jgi:DNA polymerase I-like protein with 3'-5' exonuclease and polymerase domains
LIKPPPGHAVAYIDWSSQEVGIAAALSGDETMMADFRSGDPYIAFGIGAGILPPNATKKSHEAERTAIKACVLGMQYGMGEFTLASRIGKSDFEARQLVRAHRERYHKFWMMAEGAVACAMQGRSLQTVFGWTVHPGPYSKERSMLNFPMQANGAEMMRVAACLATERGIEVCAPVHDAFLIGAPIERIEEDTRAMQAIMEEAARIVLDGFTIKTDTTIVRYPDRYMDEKRGRTMWDRVMKLLSQSPMREAV